MSNTQHITLTDDRALQHVGEDCPDAAEEMQRAQDCLHAALNPDSIRWSAPAADDSLRAIVAAYLRDPNNSDIVVAPDKAAERILRAIQGHLFARLGPDTCRCGGCDACAQHALVYSLIGAN